MINALFKLSRLLFLFLKIFVILHGYKPLLRPLSTSLSKDLDISFSTIDAGIYIFFEENKWKIFKIFSCFSTIYIDRTYLGWIFN